MVTELTSGTSEELWLISLAAASLAVVLLAVLFGLVIAVLQRIDRHAARTHTAAKQIAQNTVALWTLEQTNRDLVAIRDAASGAHRAGTASADRAGTASADRAGTASADRAGTASAVVAPLTEAKHKIQDWLGRTEHDDDKSS